MGTPNIIPIDPIIVPIDHDIIPWVQNCSLTKSGSIIKTAWKTPQRFYSKSPFHGFTTWINKAFWIIRAEQLSILWCVMFLCSDKWHWPWLLVTRLKRQPAWALIFFHFKLHVLNRSTETLVLPRVVTDTIWDLNVLWITILDCKIISLLELYAIHHDILNHPL